MNATRNILPYHIHTHTYGDTQVLALLITIRKSARLLHFATLVVFAVLVGMCTRLPFAV